MNEPVDALKNTNVQSRKLPGCANVACDLGKAHGKKGENLIVECNNHYNNTYSKLKEEPIMEISAKSHIELKDKNGEVYIIDLDRGEPLVLQGQDERRVREVVEEFREAIKEVGLRIFNEMLEENKYVDLGPDDTIDAEKIKLAVRKYLAEKEAKEEASR